MIECPPLPVRPSSPPPTSHSPLLTKSPSTPLTTHNDSDDDSDFEPVARNYSNGRRGKREKGERERGEERGRGGEREREEARGRRGERGEGRREGELGRGGGGEGGDRQVYLISRNSHLLPGQTVAHSIEVSGYLNTVGLLPLSEVS